MILSREIGEPQTLDKMVFAAACGHYVSSSIYATDIKVIFQKISHMWSVWGANTEITTPLEVRMERFLESTNVLMAQRLVHAVDGGRRALLEYLVLTPLNRSRLLEAWLKSPQAISECAQALVENEGRSLGQHAQQLAAEGKIAEEQIP